MKKVNLLIFLLITLFVFTKSVSAACPNSVQAILNRESGNVKVNYEVIREVDPNGSVPDYLIGTEEAKNYVSYIEKIQINILNLTDNLVAEVSSSYDNSTITYNSKQAKNGIVSFISKSKNDIIKYKFVIKASDTNECSGENQRTITLTQPRFNIFSTYAVCNEIPDYYLCQKYVEFEDTIDFSEFVDKTDRELASRNGTSPDGKPDNNKNWTDQISSFVKEHKKAFIIGGVGLIIVAGGIVTFIVIKRRRDVI